MLEPSSIYPGLSADPHVSQLSVTFHSSMEFHWRLAGAGGGGRGQEGGHAGGQGGRTEGET